MDVVKKVEQASRLFIEVFARRPGEQARRLFHMPDEQARRLSNKPERRGWNW
jgi:hypothetical protein